jgi:hypothetical protein
MPEVALISPPTPPPIPRRQPPKTVSVQAAKSFFESKALESRKGPPFPAPGAAAIAKGASTGPKTRKQPVRVTAKDDGAYSTRDPIPAKDLLATGEDSGPYLHVLKLSPKVTKRADSAQRTNPFARSKPASVGPDNLVETATEVKHPEGETAPRRRRSPECSAVSKGKSNSEPSTVVDTAASCGRSTNAFKEPREPAQSLSEVERSVEHHNKLHNPSDVVRAAVQMHGLSGLSSASDDSVRRYSTWKTSTAETEETTAPTDPRQTPAAQRLPCGNQVRSVTTGRHAHQPTFSNKEGSHPKRNSTQTSITRRLSNADVATRRARRRMSRSAPKDQEEDANESVRRSRRRSAMSEPTDDNVETCVRNFGEPVASRATLEDIAAQSLSHDGSGSNHSFSRHTSVPGLVPTSNTGVEEGYYSIEVPDHVDYRGSYGRRKTKDFGYPGARIKPRSTFRTYKAPLEDPGAWVKRACGHFSNISPIEPSEVAFTRPCKQCRGKHTLPDPTLPNHHRLHQRAASDSSTSSSHSRKGREERQHRHRQHHSECMPSDKCGDAFAQDLGFVIDSILEEHSNTLQSVINNIKFSQPNLAQLRRVSEDLVRRTKSTGSCSKSCHNVCRPVPCSHICQPYQPVCRPCQPSQPVQQICEWQPPCPYVPPKAAEKLNVGSPGQLGPTLNDDPSSLQDNIRSIPDVVDLVKSAADDFGVNLDDKPTASDDEKFEQAPIEATRQQSAPVVSRRSTTLKPVEEKAEEAKFDREDTWLQKTRRQLTELSEARSQLMDELDSIAEDLGVQLNDRRRSSMEIDPVQRVLSKVSTGISRKSTRLRNKSVDSVANEIPRMISQEIDERRLSRVLTRIQSQSRRISTVSQGLQEFDTIPPEEIQEWLQVAQCELPAAIESITSVLETLPALDFQPEPELESEIAQEQPEYESNVRYDDELQTQEYEIQDYDDYHEAESPRRRSRAYTEPILQLQDRIADLERRLRQDTEPIVDSFEEEHVPRTYRAATETVDSEPPLTHMANPEPMEDEDHLGEQIFTQMPALLSPRKVTQTKASSVATPSSKSSGERSESLSGREVDHQTMERKAIRRRRSIASPEASVGLKQTDFLDPEPEAELEDDEYLPLELQQKRVESAIEPELGGEMRRSTRKLTTIVSRQPTVWEIDRALTMGFPGAHANDQPGHDAEEVNFQRPVLRKAMGIEAEVSLDDEEFHSPVVRKATSYKLEDIREPALESPSIMPVYSEPMEKEETEPLPVSRQITRQPTRRQSVSMTSAPELEAERVVTRMRRESTYKLTKSPSPTREEIVEEGPFMRMRRSSAQPLAPDPVYELVSFHPLTRRPTRRDTIEVLERPSETPPVFRNRTGSMVPLSNAVTEALATFSPPASLQMSPQSELEPVTRADSSIHDTPPTSRKPTRKPTEQIGTSELPRMTTMISTERVYELEREFDSSPSPELVLRKATTRRPTERNVSHEPVLRRAMTRRQTERLPSPEPLLSKDSTRRKSGPLPSPESEPESEPGVNRTTTRKATERIPSLETVARRATTRKPPTERMASPESVIKRATTRQGTERLPSSEVILRTATTRRRTEPLVPPSAPPSSPSLTSHTLHPLPREATIQPEPTEETELPISRLADVSSRVNTRTKTMPRQTTLRRQPVEPEEIALPESAPTSPSPIIEEMPLRNPLSISPNEGEFEKPVVRMRRSPTMHEAYPETAELEPTFESEVSEPHRQPTLRTSSPSISRQPTLAERRATLEKVLLFPSRQSTMPRNSSVISPMATRRSTQTESTPMVVGRPTGQFTTRPTRRPTERDEDTIPISRRSTRRRSESDEAAVLERRATRYPTMRPIEVVKSNLRSPVVDVTQRDVETEPTLSDEEPDFELVQRDVETQPTRQSTTVSRTNTRQSIRQATLASEEDFPQLSPTPPPAAAEEPVMPVRRDKQATDISIRPTQVLRQHTLLPGEVEPLVRTPTKRTTNREPSPSPSMLDSDLESERVVRRASTQPVGTVPVARDEEVEPVVRSAATRRATERVPKLPSEDAELNDEPALRRNTTRRPTSGSLGPPEETDQEPLVHRVPTRRPTRREREPSVVHNESPPTPSHRPNPQPTRRPTHVIPQNEPISESESSSNSEADPPLEPIIRHQTSSEIENEPELFRCATTVSDPNQFGLPVVRAAVPSRQATQLEDLETLEDLPRTKTESEYTEDRPLRRSSATEKSFSREPTASSPVRTRQPTLTSRMSTVRMKTASTDSQSDLEILSELEPKLPSPRRVSEVPTRVSRHPTMQKSPSYVARSRQPTRQQTDFERQSTTRVGSYLPFTAVTRMAEPGNGEQEKLDLPPHSRGSSMQISRKLTKVYSGPPSRKGTAALDQQLSSSREDSLPSRRLTKHETLLTSTTTEPASIPEDHFSAEQPAVPRNSTTRISRLPTRAATDLGNAEPEPEMKLNPPSSSSAQSSVLDEPLADLDIYGAEPTLDNEQLHTLSRRHTRQEAPRSLRASTVEDLPEEKVIRTQEDARVRYSPPFTPSLASRQPTIIFERQNTRPFMSNERGLEEPLAQQPVSRITERQPTRPTEELPEEEPGRVDRSPTSGLGREPGSLAPPLQDTIPDGTPSESEKRASAVIPRVLTVPVKRQREPSLAAPGIVAPAVQEISLALSPAAPAMKLRKAMNVPPGQQYPPAPEYPTRDTPSWVRPDIHTPPPKPKMQAPPRRRILGFRAKPKEESQIVSRAQREPEPEPEPEHDPKPEPEPAWDRGRTQPFPVAAPGQVPGPPGGTLQRPRGYRTAPGHEPIYPSHSIDRQRTPAAIKYIPSRQDDRVPTRVIPEFAQKDHHYPRLRPLVPERRESYAGPRAAPPPTRRDIHLQRVPAHIRRDVYPEHSSISPRRDVYSQPQPIPFRRKGRIWPSRQPDSRSKYPPRHEVDAGPFYSQASEPIRHQPQHQKAPRYQEKAPPRRQAAPSVRRPPTDQEPARATQLQAEEAQPKPIRRDVHSECATSKAQPETLPAPQDEGIGRQSNGRASQQSEDCRPSEISPPSAAPEQRRRSSARGGETGSHIPQAEENPKEDPGCISTKPQSSPEDEGDDAHRQSIDGTSPESSRPSIDFLSSLPRAGTATASGPAPDRRPALQDRTRRGSSAQEPKNAAPDTRSTPSRTGTRRESAAREANKGHSRAPTRRDTARRASSSAENTPRGRKVDSSGATAGAGSRRPSTALERRATGQRLSTRDSYVSRTPPVGFVSRAPKIPKGMATAPSRTQTLGTQAGRRTSAADASEDAREAEQIRGEGTSPAPTQAPVERRNSTADIARRRSAATAATSTAVPTGDSGTRETTEERKLSYPHRISTAKEVSAIERKDSRFVPATGSPCPPTPVGQRSTTKRQSSWAWGSDKSKSAPAPGDGKGKGEGTGANKNKNGQGAGGEMGTGDGGAKAGKKGDGIGFRRWGWGWGRG